MEQSIHRLLSELPEDTDVYPGHEYTTTIAREKRYNPLAIGF
jgi:glyoxylase-like metal-dependent hydrolase (beta-lactamase superfamily II)